MRAFHVLSLTIAAVLMSVAPAAAQKSTPSMSTDLVNDLRDVEIQKRLIASGVLDAQAGLASRNQLRRAIGWFRQAHKFPNNPQLMGKLEKEERAKLQEIYEKFVATTGLQQQTYRYPEPNKRGIRTKDELRVLVPTKFVGTTLQEVDAENNEKWWEYRASNGSVAIGPELYSATEHTPMSIFKKRILGVGMKYSLLILTSDEFNSKGEVGKEDGYISSNFVLRSKDLLKGLFMRYSKQPPERFTVPDFLEQILAAQPEPPAGLDHSTRGWQLLMQSTTNLVAGEFPVDNGWTRVKVSKDDCPLSKDAPDGAVKKVRVLFGSDRKLLQPGKRSAQDVSLDSLFDRVPDNRLNIGCAYVALPAKEKENEKATARDLKKLSTMDYQMLHTPSSFDLGDHLYLTGELAESRDNAPALIFIHGYNTSFGEALTTAAQIAAATDYKGRVYLYSWPSAQYLTGYIADMDNAEQAEPYFQSFMRLLVRDADIQEIDILVHSMGSVSVLRGLSALRTLFETVKPGSRPGRDRPIGIGQIIFAAPDVSVPVFDQKIQRIAPYADRVTVYVSSTDAALLASNLLRSGAPRMGELSKDSKGKGKPALIKVKNVHVIDATGSEKWWRLDRILFGQGHDYFRQSPSVLLDIGKILQASGRKELSLPEERSPELFDKSLHDAPEGETPFPYWTLKK
jgi:esterase/lipase superfamily enzyme